MGSGTTGWKRFGAPPNERSAAIVNAAAEASPSSARSRSPQLPRPSGSYSPSRRGGAAGWASAATFDLRPGGAFRVEVLPGSTAGGEFVEIDPPKRLVYTWGWERGAPRAAGSSTVEFELVSKGTGTLLRLRHHDLPGEAAAASHRRGWAHYLPRLGGYRRRAATPGQTRGSPTRQTDRGADMTETRPPRAE